MNRIHLFKTYLHGLPFLLKCRTLKRLFHCIIWVQYKTATVQGQIPFLLLMFRAILRAVQVKQFDEQNHTTGTDFLHSIIEKHHTRNNKPLPEWLEAYNKNETKVSCLFGEHLLSKYPTTPLRWLKPLKRLFTARCILVSLNSLQTYFGWQFTI